MTTAQELLNEKPSAKEVERVESLWANFHTTTQFLAALKQVMVKYELTNEIAELEKFLPVLAQVEAIDMDAPLNAP